jgi:hypothetical protein
LENVELWVDTGEGKFPAATVLALARAGSAVMFPSKEDIARVAAALKAGNSTSLGWYYEDFAREVIKAMNPPPAPISSAAMSITGPPH